MATTHVLILGHPFAHRLHTFLLAHYGRDFVNNFNLSDDLIFKWHGRGGRTVAKIRQYDLRVVESFAPDIVILELGTNDLTQLSAPATGSAIEDLAVYCTSPTMFKTHVSVKHIGRTRPCLINRSTI